MIAKGLTPEMGAKVFAIMKYPCTHRERDGEREIRDTPELALLRNTYMPPVTVHDDATSGAA
jgi:hypothetical protein